MCLRAIIGFRRRDYYNPIHIWGHARAITFLKGKSLWAKDKSAQCADPVRIELSQMSWYDQARGSDNMFPTPNMAWNYYHFPNVKKAVENCAFLQFFRNLLTLNV